MVFIASGGTSRLAMRSVNLAASASLSSFSSPSSFRKPKLRTVAGAFGVRDGVTRSNAARLYAEVPDPGKMVSVVEEYRDDYNATSTKKVPLVMFVDAVGHVHASSKEAHRKKRLLKQRLETRARAAGARASG